MSRIRRASRGRSAVQIVRLIGLNLIYAARKISPRAIRASRREAEFDRRDGTDTSGIREMSSLDVSLAVARHGVRYQAADVRLFKRALSLLTLEPSTYVFVDYGSGKGRALLLASLYPFKEVIGVEIAPELHAIAGANIAMKVGKVVIQHQQKTSG